MNLSDIFGPGPGNQRPETRDMRHLVDLILHLDGQATEGGKRVDDLIPSVRADTKSVSYMAWQRALRACRITGVGDMNARSREVLTGAALWIEGFIMGRRFKPEAGDSEKRPFPYFNIDEIQDPASLVEAIVSADKIGEAETPHVIVSFDPEVNEFHVTGPFDDAYRAAERAKDLGQDLNDPKNNDGVDVYITIAPIHEWVE